MRHWAQLIFLLALSAGLTAASGAAFAQSDNASIYKVIGNGGKPWAMGLVVKAGPGDFTEVGFARVGEVVTILESRTVDGLPWVFVEREDGTRGWIVDGGEHLEDTYRPRIGKPACETLQRYWLELHDKFEFLGWDASNDFDCPSEKSNVATMFYYLDKIDIVDGNGNEKFDYFEYVRNNTNAVVRTSSSFSSAVFDDINIGSDYYSSHLNGFAIAIESPEVLVHEAKHTQPGTPGHGKCSADSNEYLCDESFFDIYGGEADIFDKRVGAYSVSIAYLTDVILHGVPSVLTEAANKSYLESSLRNRFLKRSAEHPNGITEDEIRRVLSRIGR